MQIDIEHKLFLKAFIFGLINCAYERLVAGLKATITPDLTIVVEFAEADRTQRKWFHVCLAHQITPIHEALKVGTVRHAKNVADFVTCRLQTAIDQ